MPIQCHKNLLSPGCILFSFLLAAATGVQAQIPTKDDLQHQIDSDEKLLEAAKASAASPLQLGRLYLRLSTLEQDAGELAHAEHNFNNAIRSLQTPPVSLPDLTAAIDGLGTLYLQMGSVEEAERAELKALSLREQSSEKADIARSCIHLATLYLVKHRASLALAYAKQAIEDLSSTKNPSPEDNIAARLSLALSLSWLHQYSNAIDTLHEALRLMKDLYGPDDFPIGFATFLLGYTHWKAGDCVKAGELMKQGADSLSRQLGWWSPDYCSIMTCYARFLRTTGQKPAASAIERNLRSARSAFPNERRNQTLAAALY